MSARVHVCVHVCVYLLLGGGHLLEQASLSLIVEHCIAGAELEVMARAAALEDVNGSRAREHEATTKVEEETLGIALEEGSRMRRREPNFVRTHERFEVLEGETGPVPSIELPLVDVEHALTGTTEGGCKHRVGERASNDAHIKLLLAKHERRRLVRRCCHSDTIEAMPDLMAPTCHQGRRNPTGDIAHTEQHQE